MSPSSERPEDCATRVAIGLGSGFAAGAFFGAVTSNWGDVPTILRDKPWPTLVGGALCVGWWACGLVAEGCGMQPNPLAVAGRKHDMTSTVLHFVLHSRCVWAAAG